MALLASVRISQNPTSEARVSHDQGHIYITLWIHLSKTYTYIRYTINQLIPPIYWFSSTHKSSPLHVLLSSNLDRIKQHPSVSSYTQELYSANISNRPSLP